MRDATDAARSSFPLDPALQMRVRCDSANYLDRVTELSAFLGNQKILHLGMCCASRFAKVAITRNTNRERGGEAMATLANLELPTQLSPCLRLFIERLFDEVGVKRGASWNHPEFQPALPRAVRQKDEELDMSGVTTTERRLLKTRVA